MVHQGSSALLERSQTHTTASTKGARVSIPDADDSYVHLLAFISAGESPLESDPCGGFSFGPAFALSRQIRFAVTEAWYCRCMSERPQSETLSSAIDAMLNVTHKRTSRLADRLVEAGAFESADVLVDVTTLIQMARETLRFAGEFNHLDPLDDYLDTLDEREVVELDQEF